MSSIKKSNQQTFSKEFEERKTKILGGLKIAYEKMLEMKRQKKSVVVVSQKGKIVHLKP